MKITGIEAIPVRIAMKKPFAIALGTQTHTQNILISMTDDEGHEGWAETTTFHVIYGIDQKMLHHVASSILAPAVMGMDPRDFRGLHEVMDLTIPYNEVVKCGIDLAAHDLVSRALGQPLCMYLGGKRMDRIPTIGVVGIEPPAEAAASAALQVRDGHRTIKIKIGLNAKEDLERVIAVRDAVGRDVALRVDGNQRYDRPTALRVFRSMEKCGLEWIEQPLPDWDFEGHAQLAERLDTPIALDESIRSIQDVHRAAATRAAGIINIKVNRVGGIYKARQVASASAAAGLRCFLGSNIELSPGTAAWAHFFAATDNIFSAAEIIGPSFYADDVVSPALLSEGGSLPVPTGPGIGIEIDKEKLAKYRIAFSP